jgi:hypothetical protein
VSAASVIRSRAAGPRSSGPAAIILAATLAACASTSTDRAARPAAPPPVPVVGVKMVDHRFELDRPVPRGRVVFQFDNAGQAPHNVVMIPLAEGLPPIDVQLRGSERRFVEPFAGIYERGPGDSGSFAVDLLADQRYAIVCTVIAEDGRPHWTEGMAIEFRTPPAPATTGATTPPSRP